MVGSPKLFKVIMVRHGESEWNQKNLFCGWFDAQLSNKGKDEAKAAGVALKNINCKLDKAYTSLLSRAQNTLQLILRESGNTRIPIVRTWRLNERHYGSLTGLNKADTAKKYGEDKVKIWRRSFDVPPPPMEKNHPYYDKIVKDPRYADGPPLKEFPMFESLKLTIARTLPFWDKVISPDIKSGKRLIIAAHGNSLRGIVKHLDKMSDKQIMGLNLPTGIPFVYTLNEKLEPIKGGSLQFIGDPATVKKAMDKVAKQGKVK